MDIYSGDNVPIEVGNAMPLELIPLGSIIHNVELTFGVNPNMVPGLRFNLGLPISELQRESWVQLSTLTFFQNWITFRALFFSYLFLLTSAPDLLIFFAIIIYELMHVTSSSNVLQNAGLITDIKYTNPNCGLVTCEK